MDILTSKPPLSYRKKIRHHLIDIISPEKEFSVAEYRKLAIKKIGEIIKRKKTPLFVGGSGLYVKAVIDGLFPSAKKSIKFIKAQERLANRYGKKYLYRKLLKIDSERAKDIHPNDLRRIIRALEIYYTEKKRPSDIKIETKPLPYDFKIFGISIDRDILCRNIDNRVEDMFKKGIIKEVKVLSRKKLSMTAKKALGYNEILGFLNGRYRLDEAKEILKKNTRHFAKRQLTWFRPDKRITWLSSSNFTL